MNDRVAARWPVLVACVAALVYLPTLRNGFALDDVPLVRDNVDIRSLSDLPRLFALPYWNVGEQTGLYRPVTIASFAVNRAITGEGPFGFHLVNIALHALVAALVWFVARGSGPYYGTALLTGLLFAVHPQHAEAVANIAGRSELLSAAFVLAAWLAHRHQRRVLAAAMVLLAILSKESAILAPLLFLADDALVARRDDRSSRPWRITAWAGYTVALAIALVARIAALGGIVGAANAIYLDNPAAFAGTLVRVGTALWTLALHLKTFVWPAALVCDYSYDAIPLVRNVSDPRLWVGLVLAGGWIAALIACWRGGRRTLFLGLAASALFVLPSANILFPTGVIFAERLFYLPSFGLCLIVGHCGAAVATGAPWPRGSRARAIAVGGVAAIALLALAGRATIRGFDWKDNLTLAIADVAAQPRSAKLHAGAGIALEQAGRAAEAEAHLQQAVAIWPDYAQARFNLAVLLARRGEREAAIAELRAAVATGARNPRPWDLLVTLLEDDGRRADALEVCARAYELFRDDPRLAQRCSRLARDSGYSPRK